MDHDCDLHPVYICETHNRWLGERGSIVMDIEMIVMKLVVNGGNARSTAIEALRAAKAGDFKKADELMEEADTILKEAHEIQTEMIQNEIKRQ